jgi:RecB family exonuclease
MPVQRLTKADIDARKAKIAMWEKQIERWDTLKREAENPGFKLLKESLEAAVKSTEKEIMALVKEPSSDTVADRNKELQLGGRLLMAEMILGDMTASEKKYEHARERIAILKAEIEEATERGGLVSIKERA